MILQIDHICLLRYEIMSNTLIKSLLVDIQTQLSIWKYNQFKHKMKIDTSRNSTKSKALVNFKVHGDSATSLLLTIFLFLFLPKKMRLVYISNLWDPSVSWISNYLIPRVFWCKPPSRLREPQRPKLRHDAPHAEPKLHHHVYGHDAIPRIVIVQGTHTHPSYISFFLFFGRSRNLKIQVLTVLDLSTISVLYSLRRVFRCFRRRKVYQFLLTDPAITESFHFRFAFDSLRSNSSVIVWTVSLQIQAVWVLRNREVNKENYLII